MKGTTEGEVAEWHHQLKGHESEQTCGDSGGQRRLACCSPRGRKEWDATERLNKKSDNVENGLLVFSLLNSIKP